MKKFAGFLLFFVFLGIGGVWGQNTYTSTGSGNWNAAATWGGTGFPVAGDTATIRAVDTVTLTAAAAVGTLTNNGTVNLGTYVLTIPAAGLTNNGTIIFGGAGNTNQLPNRTSITGTAVFRNTGTTLSTITSFTNLTIEAGARTGAGAVTVSGNFSITGGSLNATSINVTGTSNISANITTGTGTSQRYYQAVTLGNNVILSGTGAAPVIRFDSTVDSDATPRSLTITNAAFQFRGNVGLTSRLSSISNNYNAESRVLYGVYTTGDQTYSNGSIRINSGANSDVIFHSSGIGSTITFAAITNTASRTLTITSDNVHFNGNIGANIALTSLTVNPSTGTIAINANVTTTGNQTYNGTIALGAATRTLTSSGGSVNAAGIISGTAGVTVSAAAGITMTAANTLTGTVTLNKTGAGAGAISYTSNHVAGNTVTVAAVNSAATGGSIAINATTGNLIIGTTSTATPTGTIDITTTNGTINVTGAIGTAGNGVVALTSSNSNQNITIGNTINCNSLTVSPGTGTIAINANITTTGNQQYNGAVTLGGGNAGDTRTLAGSGAGNSTVTFSGTVNGARALVITAANASFGGIVGTDATSGNRLSSISVAGTATVNADIFTNGSQIYSGNVILNNATTFTFNATTTAGRTIQFGTNAANTVGSANTTARALNVISQNITFNGTAGGTTAPISTLDAEGTGTIGINANITTAGYSNISGDANTTQIYTGAIVLGANVTLTGPAGRNIRVQNTVNGAFGLIIAGSNINFVNRIGNSTPLARLETVTGDISIYENSGIDTTGDQIYNGAFIFYNATARTLTSTGGSISFNGAVSRQNPANPANLITISASQNISMNYAGNTVGGNITLNSNQAAGAGATNISFRTSGDIILNAANNSTGGTIVLTASGNLTIGALNAPNGSITLGSSASLTVPEITNTGTISTGTLTIYSAGAVTRTTSANNTVNRLIIGRAGGNINFIRNGALEIAGIANAASSNIDISTTAGNITVSGAVSTNGTIALATAAAGTITISAGITANGGNNTTHDKNASLYINTGTLTGTGSITLSTSGWACVHLAAALSYSGTVTGNIHYHTVSGGNIVYTTTGTNITGITTNPLRINADEINSANLHLTSSGNIYIVNIYDFNGAGTHQANTRGITFDAAGYIEFQQTNLMTGTLSLTFNGASNNIRLNGASLDRGTNAFDYDVTLVGSYNDNRITASSITLGTVTAEIANNFNGLSLTAATGNVTFNNAITTAIRNLTAEAAGTININQNITTTGNQIYGNTANTQTILLGSATRTLTGGGTAATIQFNGIINQNASTLIANNANVRFNGNVTLNELIKNAIGSTTINANITTTNAQSYGGTVEIIAPNNTTSRTLTGTTVTFGGGITGNNNTLIVNGHTANSADARFNGAANNSIGVLTVNGVTTLGVTPIAFIGIGSAAPASVITFGGAVNSNNSTARALTITNANVVFNGPVGANTSFPVTSVTVNATGAGNTAGSAQIGADITTTGAQTYGGPVVLNPVTGNNINFTAAAGVMINFTNTITGNTLAGSGTARELTITNANVTFGGEVGANSSIASIDVTADVTAGSATINNNITTTGDQDYAVVIFGAGGASPRTLTSSGGSISASGAVSRSGYNDAITVIANKGISLDNTSLNGSITLNNQGTAAANDITFRTSAAVTLAAVNTAASGHIKVNQTGTLTIASLLAPNGSVTLGESNTVSVGAINNQTGAIITPSLTIRSSGAVTLNNNSVNNEVGSLLIERAAGAVNFSNSINLTIAGISGVAANNINITTTAGSITAGGNIDTTGTVALTSAGSITVNGNIANAATGVITLTSADDQNIVINASAAINGARVLLIAGEDDDSTGIVNIAGNIIARNPTTNHNANDTIVNNYRNSAVHIKAGTLTGSGGIQLMNANGTVCVDLLAEYSYNGNITNNTGAAVTDRLHFHTRTNRHIAYGHGTDNLSHGKTNYLYINALLTNLGDVLGLTTTGTGEIYIIGRSSAIFPARDVTLTTAAGGLIEFIGNYQSDGTLTFNPASGIINLNNAQINLTGAGNSFSFSSTGQRLVLVNSPSVTTPLSTITATSITINTITSPAAPYSLTLNGNANSGAITVNGNVGADTERLNNFTIRNESGNVTTSGQVNTTGAVSITTDSGMVNISGQVHSNGAVTINNSDTFTLTAGAHITAGSFAKIGTGNSSIAADITAATNTTGTISFNNTLALAASITLTTANSAINLGTISRYLTGVYNLHLDSGSAAINISGTTEIFGSLNVDCSDITISDDITVHGVTTMGNSGNFKLDNANADFIGNYITENNGEITSGTNAVVIKFGANVRLGNVTLSNANSKIIFYHGVPAITTTIHDLSLSSTSINIQSNIEIQHGNTVKLVSGIINQIGSRSLTIDAGGNFNDGTGIIRNYYGAVLDVSAGSWHMGSAGSGTNHQFAGGGGNLHLGGTSDRAQRDSTTIKLSSRLIVNELHLTSSFNIRNTNEDCVCTASVCTCPAGWAFIQVHGNADIASTVSITPAQLPYLVLEMEGSSSNVKQTLRADHELGSLHIGVNSQTELAVTAPGSAVSFHGEVIIKALSAPAGLVAGNLDIIMKAGLTGSRDLDNYMPGTADVIKYTRWEVLNAVYINLPPFESVPNMEDFVFRQVSGKQVSFKRENVSDTVFFEIVGNTMWQTFECSENGAVIQFSRDPNHHTILEFFNIKGDDTGSNNENYVTITRLTDKDSYNFPYIYSYAKHGPPPQPPPLFPDITIIGTYAIPVFYPPMNLKSAHADERGKFWNINLVSNPTNAALENFECVNIYFSHAYNHRIPIDSGEMKLNVVPYYSVTDTNGYFNYDWVQIRKILYSFTEDGNGDGRLDRIRVQTNIALNGNFSGFRARVDGYEIDTSKGDNGYELVSAYTGFLSDTDSFYIYLKELPDLYTGSLPDKIPLWHVIENSTLRDSMTGRSPVGDPNIDINIRPFDTIPPRVSYTLTLPNHNETYMRFSEPVVFDGAVITNGVLTFNSGLPKDAASLRPYTFVWQYFDVDDKPLTLSDQFDSGHFGYLIEWQEASSPETAPYSLTSLMGLVDIASLFPASDGRYFSVTEIFDQAHHAMDWRDENLGAEGDIFYTYYSHPKYPLNWAYTRYAYVSGNKHLVGTPNDPGFADKPYTAYTETPTPNDIVIETVFTPPYRALTIEMMADLAASNPRSIRESVIPSRFDSVGTITRRLTDTLISLPPSANRPNDYFAWPIWARYNDSSLAPPAGYRDTEEFYNRLITETDVIWNFGGADGINVYLDYIGAKGDVEMQVRLSEPVIAASRNIDLLWTVNIPSQFRNPAVSPVQGRNTGGLWSQNNSYLFYLTPALDNNSRIHSLPPSSYTSSLFNFVFGKNTPYNSGDKIEFVFRFSNTPAGFPNTDMILTRLDIQPGAAIPSNWYHLVRPFGFDIREMRTQRGGVSILNNVINSDNREVAYIRYDLRRAGRVTVQVYTLDGTLVKSIRRNEYRAEGVWTDGWDGTNNSGRPVARGMYFIRVVGPDIDEIRNVMVVR